MYDLISNGKSNVALYVTIFEMFAKRIKCQKCDLENEGHDQGAEKRDLRHSTGNVQFNIGDFFRILATWEHTFTQKLTHLHTYLHPHPQRDKVDNYN